MKRLIIVGDRGYIGSRLSQDALTGWDSVTGIDLGIYGAAEPRGRTRSMLADVIDLPTEMFQGATVLYLATGHASPKRVAKPTHWERVYRTLMVSIPWSISKVAGRMVYLSSMRAVTHPDTLYGQTKAEAERVLIGMHNTVILRPGTVWGDLRKGAANRTTTAVNIAWLKRAFVGDTWKAYTCAMPRIQAAIQTALTAPAYNVVQNVVDTPEPLVAEDIRSSLGGKGPLLLNGDTMGGIGVVASQDERAIENFRRYYLLQEEASGGGE